MSPGANLKPLGPFGRFIGRVMVVTGIVLFILSAFLGVFFGLLLATYFAIVAFGLVLFSLFAWSGHPSSLRLMIPIAIAVIVMFNMFRAKGMVQVQDGFERIRTQYAEAGQEGLSPFDKVVIFQANIFFSATDAVLGSPEAGVERFLRGFKSEGSRTFKSDFAMQDPAVRGLVDDWLARARKTDSDEVQFPARQVKWQAITPENVRVASALNNATITGKIHRGGGGRQLVCQAVVPCDYPKGTVQTHRLPGPLGEVRVDYTLFNALEDAGWLHPYEAVWVWTIDI